jgi:hypothetical protein
VEGWGVNSERERRIRKIERGERFDVMDGDCIEKRDRYLR